MITIKKMNTTIENDKLITEFMGNKVIFDGITYHFYPEDLRQKELRAVANINIFSKDWNWLMEVVEKIESLENVIEFVIKKTSVDLSWWTTDNYKRACFTDLPKIEAVYNACVAFIEWYNSAQKEN